MPMNPWPSEWLRGLLTLAVLRVLADGPTYGYEIAARLEEGGFGVIKGGSLYPLLSRLEVAGHVSTEWREGQGGPGRKYFLLTDQGREEFARQAQQWRHFSSTTHHFLAPIPGAGPIPEDEE